MTAAAVAWLIGGIVQLYGILAMSLLGAKLLLAMTYRRYRSKPGPINPGDFTVVAVVPIYNEDPDTFEHCLRSLHGQSRTVDKIHVVDDASHDLSAVERARSLVPMFAEAGIELVVSIQPENKGKREALSVGFLADPDADIYLCVDSDTVLDPAAVKELLKPMSDPGVKAVTGLVLALNQRKNILTRLIDLRYGNAFLFERAAYSRLGSVLCCCGSLVVYRSDVVRDNLHDFLNQEFLGKPAVFGDDRRLTNYCLLVGQVLFQESAVAYTAVPEKLQHFIRQQVRWNKSFFRESQWALRKLSKKRPGAYLTFIEVATWLVFSSAMLTTLVVMPIKEPRQALHSALLYMLFTVLMGYARSVRYLDFARPGTTLWQRLGIYTLAPVYGLLHLFLLLPIRVYALMTMTRGKWGTRENGVEIVDDVQATGGLTGSADPGAVPHVPGPRPAAEAQEHTPPLTFTSASWPQPETQAPSWETQAPSWDTQTSSRDTQVPFPQGETMPWGTVQTGWTAETHDPAWPNGAWNDGTHPAR